MRGFILLGVLVLCVSCGSGSGSGGANGGAGGNGGSGGKGGGGGSGGKIDPPPVPDSCKPPATAADVSNPTTVVSNCDEAGLDAAISKGGVITFDCGGPATITVTSAKVISKDTVIDGGGNVTISGGGTTRIFKNQGEVDLTVQNITLSDAMVNGPRGSGPSDTNCGAAIWRHSDSKLTVVNVTFENNKASKSGNDIAGGAIYSYGGDTIITGSTFDGNSAASGGAIGNLRSNLTIVNSTFVNNHALEQNGGAVALDGQNKNRGKVFTLCGVVAKNNQAALEGGAVYRYGYPGESTVIDSSTFDGNSVGEQGGGLYVHTDTPGAMPLTLTNSTISNNTSDGGVGGMTVFGCPATLTNVTISGNRALGSLAGGLAMRSVPGTFTNVTIADNHADKDNSFAGAVIGSENITFHNCLFAGNTGGNQWNPVNCTDTGSGDHNMQFPDKQPSGQDDTPCVKGITFADPMLGPLGDNGGSTQTMPLMPGSPAIGVGANCPTTDQRGVTRSGSCDLGAYQTN